MNVIKSVMTVGSVTVLSRITGFLRDVVTAAYLGVSPITDAVIVAIRLANFLRRIFAEGAFSSSFVPVFSRVLAKNNKKTAEDLASKVLSILAVFLLIFSLFVIINYELVIRLLAPGFKPGSEKFIATVELGRICFPYITALFATALFCGVLNSLGKFAIPASAQIILNVFFMLAMILGKALGFSNYKMAVLVCYAMILAGITQVALVWTYTLKSGLKIKLVYPKFSKEVKEVLIKMLPGLLGAGVWQINLLIDTQVSSFLPTGSIAYIYFADRINQLPIGILGATLGTALLPSLSKFIQIQKTNEAMVEFNKGLRIALSLCLPATISLLVIPVPIVSLIYERGNFVSVIPVAYTLAAFSIGIPAYVLTKVFSAVFFAYGDTKTPAKIGIISVLANICGILLFAPFLAHVGIALATACSSWVNLITLYLLLSKRKMIVITNATKMICLRQLLVSLSMGMILIFSEKFFSATILLIAIGGISFFALGAAFRIFQWQEKGAV